MSAVADQSLTLVDTMARLGRRARAAASILANTSAETRQQNRRTEIILTPKLDELFKILEQN